MARLAGTARLPGLVHEPAPGRRRLPCEGFLSVQVQVPPLGRACRRRGQGVGLVLPQPRPEPRPQNRPPAAGPFSLVRVPTVNPHPERAQTPENPRGFLKALCPAGRGSSDVGRGLSVSCHRRHVRRRLVLAGHHAKSPEVESGGGSHMCPPGSGLWKPTEPPLLLCPSLGTHVLDRKRRHPAGFACPPPRPLSSLSAICH